MATLNEIGRGLLVDQKKLVEHYKDVQSFHTLRARMRRQMSRVSWVVAALALVANFAQAWTIAGMLPLTRIVPVYLWVRPDGTIDSSVSMSRLPPTQNKAVIDASLWEYVRMREGYSYDTARYAYDMVANYSAPSVAEQYQNWFNYPNPASPQVLIGRKGTITVSHIASSDLGPAVQQIRFTLTIAIDGAAPRTSTMTATIHYATARSLPQKVRLTNPGGVLVTSYQSVEDTTK